MEENKKATIEEPERFKVTEKDQVHEFSKEKFRAVGFDIYAFFRNLLFAVILGLGIGAYATGFALLINLITDFRTEHLWLILLLPVGGLVIVGFYHLLGAYSPKGTNRVLESISSDEQLPLKMTPLITVGTAITHFFGGSAGREGAALQIGGSLGMWFGKAFRLGKREVTVMTLCGMSAAFSAMFGTPLTAAVFAMEVVSIGILHYSALVPCVVSALTAGLMARLIGYVPEAYPAIDFPSFGWLNGLETVGLGIMCAIVSIAFCILLHKTEHYYQKFIPNSYLRAVTGGLLVVLITVCVGSADFNGAGIPVIMNAVSGHAVWYAFLLKMLMTALTLGACYKGGEIIPTIFVGATFGCIFAPLIGLDPSVGAALGVCGVFCGVTNCPIASICLCIELFGIKGLPLYLIAAAVSYRLSGYYGIYTGQKIMYSKSRPLFINRTTWK
ncbi:MAG: chloride channel protein [Parasporobacterium sp.]|nr:chloride channel protein [Parasporobacterium sp.]